MSNQKFWLLAEQTKVSSCNNQLRVSILIGHCRTICGLHCIFRTRRWSYHVRTILWPISSLRHLQWWQTRLCSIAPTPRLYQKPKKLWLDHRYTRTPVCDSMRGRQHLLECLWRRAITPRTKMIIINTPHNPVGKVFTKNELEAIAAIAEEFNLLVMADEVVS